MAVIHLQFWLILQTVISASQSHVYMEEFAVVLEEGTTVTVEMVTLGRTAKVSSNVHVCHI